MSLLKGLSQFHDYFNTPTPEAKRAKYGYQLRALRMRKGYAVLMIYFQPQVHIDAAIAQVGAAVQSTRFRFPAGVNPPWVLRFNASTVPIYQLALSSDTLSQSELYDYGIFRVRQKISAIAGTLLSAPHGGVVRQIMVDLNQQALLAHGPHAERC